MDLLIAADFFFDGAPHVISDRRGAAFGFHKPISIWQFSDIAATGSLGRRGGGASKSDLMFLQRDAEPGLPADRRAQRPQSWKNCGSPAKFEYPYTTRTWRFLGRESRHLCLL